MAHRFIKPSTIWMHPVPRTTARQMLPVNHATAIRRLLRVNPQNTTINQEPSSAQQRSTDSYSSSQKSEATTASEGTGSQSQEETLRDRYRGPLHVKEQVTDPDHGIYTVRASEAIEEARKRVIQELGHDLEDVADRIVVNEYERELPPPPPTASESGAGKSEK
ncbi:hypothetical protein HK102_009681 [Quaeritorhiza haematococci]|nr:hypothetical protein HK102_009681 [Quaeritorhiza haematococci]